MPKIKLISRCATTVVAGIASLALVACSGGGGSPQASQNSDENGNALEQTSVKIALTGVGTISNAPLFIAQSQGYFEDEGLTVDLTELKGGSDAIQSLVAGSVAATTNEYIHTIDTQLKGKNITSVVTITTAPTYAMVLTKGNFNKTVSDLQDMKIGVVSLGGSTEDLVKYIFEKNGLDPEKANLIAIGVGSSQSAAIRASKVDASIATQPTLSTSLKSGDAKILLDFRKSSVVKEIFGGTSPFWSLIVNNSFAEDNPHTTRALANAVVKGLEYMQSHSSAEIAKLLPADSYYPDGNVDQFESILGDMLDAYTTDGIMPEGGPQNIENYYETANPDADVDSLDLNKTFSNKFVE